jgi:Holliday junction DNA helicase RuvA
MYDHVLGEVIERQLARVVLRVGGVGYDLKVPTSTAQRLEVGTTAQLFTILHVVDGVPTLLGFATRFERDLSRRLMSVSGVGPAISLALLSAYTPGQIVDALIAGDHRFLTRVKGIGAKTAERLCLELRDHAAKLDLGEPREAVTLVPQSREDAVAALVTLGYTEKEARAKLARFADARPEASTEELVKSVLRS